MFHRVKEWIVTHPYLSGGLVLLVVVYFVIRNAGNSNSQAQSFTTGPSASQLAADAQNHATDVQATTANNALNAAVAAKQIDSNTTLGVAAAQVQLGSRQADDASQAAIQVAAFNLAGRQAEAGAAVQAQQSANQASVAIAGLQYGATVQVAQIQSNTSLGLATIQAPIQELQLNNQLKAQMDIDATSLGITKLNDAAQVDINGQNTNRDITVNQSNNDVKNHQTDAQLQLGLHSADVTQNIYTDLIDTQGRLSYQQEADKKNVYDQLLAGVNAGVYNKGGEGGVNQIAALATLTGNSGGVDASAATHQSANAETASIVGGITKFATGLVGTIF